MQNISLQRPSRKWSQKKFARSDVLHDPVQTMAENSAETLMIRYLQELIKTISHPSSLACGLFTRRIISRAVYNETIDSKSGISKQDKSASVCDAVLQSVHVTASHLVEFVEEARKDSPALDALCKEITKDPVYGEYHSRYLTSFHP